MPREPKSLRELADYVVENADKIIYKGKPLSKLPTKDALSCMASIVRSGKLPAPPPSTSPYPFGLPEPSELALGAAEESA